MIIIISITITLPNSTHDHIDDDNANDNEHWWRADDNGGGQNLVVTRMVIIQVKFHFGNVFSSRVVAPIALVPKAESHDYDNDDGGRPDTDPCQVVFPYIGGRRYE